MLKEWRLSNSKSLRECAAALGLGEHGGRTFHRYEHGAVLPEADIIERIERLTGGAVTASDMHKLRLAYLRETQPDRFAQIDAVQPIEGVASESVWVDPEVAVLAGAVGAYERRSVADVIAEALLAYVDQGDNQLKVLSQSVRDAVGERRRPVIAAPSIAAAE